jgi:hypothetical protein
MVTFDQHRAARSSRAAAAPVQSHPRTSSPVARPVPTCACGGTCPRCQNKLPIQTNLTVSQPGDPYEQQADRMAEQVMHLPPLSATGPAIQRKCSVCSYPSEEEHGLGAGKAPFGQSCDSAPATGRDEEEAEPALAMRKSESGATLAPTWRWAQRLSQTKGSGQALSPEARSFFELRLGHEFNQVRVHHGEHASNLAGELGAEAFTNGADIYFKSGRYDPRSLSGMRLLAHELTHVVQQNALGTGDRIQRYRLNGFPAAEEAKMQAAIPKAISKVKACSKLSWWGKHIIPPALRRMRYDYVPDLGLCGWTFPASWYIEVGPDAFKQNVCCDLESTLAHEAAHTEWYTEGRARAMECNCFGCSC